MNDSLPLAATMPGLPAAEAFPRELAIRLAARRIIAVVTVDDDQAAVPLARALVEGGITGMELAWRTPATLSALRAIRAEVPAMLAGIGTLLTPAQVDAAWDAGALFGVSPGLSPAVITAARMTGMPYAPGVQTASDLHAAIESGCRLLKYFPAESGRGLAHLRSISAPFAHLDLQFIALGGIDEARAFQYLAEPSIAVVGGSWIAPAALIRQRDWDAIRVRAVAAHTAGAAHGREAWR